jgi:hypothetical protein
LNPFKIQGRFNLEFVIEFITLNCGGIRSREKRESCSLCFRLSLFKFWSILDKGKVTKLNYKVCAGFEILEKESVTVPLASSPRQPTAACPGPRVRGSNGGMVTTCHLTPALSAARHASSTRRTGGHHPMFLISHCYGLKEKHKPPP